ncbi:unnamed protein product [Cyclocybe aegerita]|uniref:Uncharacterized protein n=1 Tax=Cyclocybe aegerita TaxID=1973307 RepID=A0A8S0VTX6_CYCAE|nr:unnamed protein product [Cyclocybe aegerita]
MAAQTVSYPSEYKAPRYPFLANPPLSALKKQQRPAPAGPLPAPPCSPPPVPVQLHRRRSNTYSNIIAWASLVQPGSPAPRSPHRRPSITSTTSRRPSLSRLNRRPSITHGRAPSGPFVHIVDTPTRTHTTASVADFDLTALGYTSVFVHLPKTPTTPSPYLRQYHATQAAANGAAKPPTPLTASAFAHIPIPPIPQDVPAPTKRLGMKRFRSLSILRPKKGSKNTVAPPSPTKSTRSTKTTATGASRSKPSTTAMRTRSSSLAQAEICAASIAKRKRAKYAYVRPPPPLANELALMQFADGGSMESHVKRVMDAQAKAAAGTSGQLAGVADVYRDGKGGVWWDADEEMEYAHLLGGQDETDEMDWEEFDDAEGEPLAPFLANTSASSAAANKENLGTSTTPEERRDSISTVDSDLDPKYLLPLPENAPVPSFTTGTPDDHVLASTRIGGAGMSVLSLPARPRRAALHLHKPRFMLDAAAFGPPRSPGSSSPKPPRSPRSPTGERPRGQARRRPAPLKLASSAHVRANVKVARREAANQLVGHSGTAARQVPSPSGAEKARREFMEDSFAPAVPEPAPASMVVDLPPSIASSKRYGMRALFGRRGN